MLHPRCVGWGEIGLDYKNNSIKPEIQHLVFAQQLRHAVKLGKPITIHTREAEEDTERILKAEVPIEHPVRCLYFESASLRLFYSQIHVHCYTDGPELALRLLEHFPNLYFGITGTHFPQYHVRSD